MKYIMRFMWMLLPMILVNCSKIKQNAPVPPTHKGYIFQHQIIVPRVEGKGCHEGWIENITQTWNTSRDKKLESYSVDSQELEEGVKRLKARIDQTFTYLHGKEQAYLENVFRNIRPFLPPQLQDTEIHFVTHKLAGDSYINAFTFPGYIYVTRGLMNIIDNEHELALILGHEISHLANEHFAEGYQAKERWLSRLGAIGIDSENSALVATFLEQILTTSLGQADELSADLGGVYLCTAAGYDPVTGAKIFDTFNSFHNPNRSFWSRVSSTHPHPENRKACLDSYLAVAKDSANLVYNKEYQAYQMALLEMEKNQWSWKQPDFSNNTLPITCMILGVFVFLLGRKKYHLTPLVPVLGIAIFFGSSAFLFTNNNESNFLQFSSEEWDNTCEYADQGCNMVKQKARISLTSGSLNIRLSPSISDNIIGSLIDGDIVNCHYCSKKDRFNNKSGRWCKVSLDDGTEGWAWGVHLKLMDK